MENMGNRENRDMGQWGNRERIGQMGHIENRDMGKWEQREMKKIKEWG